jgi:hypothetical protein
MKWLWLTVTLLGGVASAQTAAINGFCYQGGQSAVTQGLGSTNKQQGIVPSCTVSVFLAGTTTLATIYKDGVNTPLANPFTANALGSAAPGQWLFYVLTTQGVDITMSGGIPPNVYATPVTLTDVQPGGGGSGGANLTPAAIQFALTTSTTRGATFNDVGNLFTGAGPCFLNKNGSCSNSTAFPAGSTTQVQSNQSGVFGVDTFFLDNATTHNVLSRQFNNLPYASQYQSPANTGENGIAQYLATAGANQVVLVDSGDGITEVNNVLSPSTPDNSTILDMRPPGATTATFGAPGISTTQRNCLATSPPFASAIVAIPYCTSIWNYWSNSTGDNNTNGGYAQMVGSFRDGPGIDYGFDSIGNPWTVTQGQAVNVAMYAPGIVDGFTTSIQKNSSGDINGISLAVSAAGGQGTAGSDQGLTAFALNGGQSDIFTMTTVASTTGTGDRHVIPAPFAGTAFYNRIGAGNTYWMLDMNAPVVGSTGGLTGVYVYVEGRGSGMTNGTYTVTCSGGGGSGGTLQVVVTSNQVNFETGATVLTPGSGYTSAPTCAGWSPGGIPTTFIPVIAVSGQMGITTVAPGSTYMRLMTVSGVSLTPSTGDVVTSSTAPQSSTPGTYQTDTMTAVVNNNHPLVAGLAWAADAAFPERVTISNVTGGTTTGSTQTFSISHQDPKQSGMNIYQGGTQGCILEDQNFVMTGILQCDFAFGAIDATHLLYGKLSHGQLNIVNLPNMFANTTSGLNGFHIFSGANVLFVNPVIPGDIGTNGGQPTLGYNDVAWHSGDYFAQPQPTGFDMTGVLAGAINSNSPSDNGDIGIFLNFSGGHWDANLDAVRILNNNPDSWYQNHGGNLTSPHGLNMLGNWNELLFANEVPANSVITVQDHGARVVWLAGTLALVSDSPNNRWDIGGAGLIMTGPLSTSFLTYSQDPSVNVGNQVLESNSTNGGASFYSSIGSAVGLSDGILGIQELDAGTVRAGTAAPSTFFIAGGPTAGSTTYTWVATSETASGGETLPGSPLVSTIGPTSLSGSNFYHLSGSTQPGAQWFNVYRRTGGGGTGLICHLTITQLAGTGCLDTGQTATTAEPTSDTSGQLIVAGPNASVAGHPIATVDTGSPTVGQAACIKSAGPPIQIGTCSTAVGSSGACTCN